MDRRADRAVRGCVVLAPRRRTGRDRGMDGAVEREGELDVDVGRAQPASRVGDDVRRAAHGGDRGGGSGWRGRRRVVVFGRVLDRFARRRPSKTDGLDRVAHARGHPARTGSRKEREATCGHLPRRLLVRLDFSWPLRARRRPAITCSPSMCSPRFACATPSATAQRSCSWWASRSRPARCRIDVCSGTGSSFMGMKMARSTLLVTPGQAGASRSRCSQLAPAAQRS